MTPDEAHWDAAYTDASADTVSWYQREPTASLALIERLCIPPEAAVLDVGGGASALAETLVRRGFHDVSVLDVSERALDACRQRLGSDAERTHLLHHDVLAWRPSRRYDLWHDRAVLHFFVEPEQRARYIAGLKSAVGVGAAVILGVFAENGPERCSGLPVLRYSAAQLSSLLGSEFEPFAQTTETHITPGGAAQPFQWIALIRRTSA